MKLREKKNMAQNLQYLKNVTLTEHKQFRRKEQPSIHGTKVCCGYITACGGYVKTFNQLGEKAPMGEIPVIFDENSSPEDYLEQYLAGNYLDSVESCKLVSLMRTVHRTKRRLASTMYKKAARLPSIKTIEKEAIGDALAYHRGNVTKAAKALGIARNTVYRKMKKTAGKKMGVQSS